MDVFLGFSILMEWDFIRGGGIKYFLDRLRVPQIPFDRFMCAYLTQLIFVGNFWFIKFITTFSFHLLFLKLKIRNKKIIYGYSGAPLFKDIWNNTKLLILLFFFLIYGMKSNKPKQYFKGNEAGPLGSMGREPAHQTSEPGSNPSWDAAVHPVCKKFNVMHVV